jgi:putative ABC transport system permease protein
MKPGIFKLVLRTIIFYKKPVFYQVLIIALLSAVITGSLLTGSSVRSSLKRSATQKLGNTGIAISSGTRYFDVSLVKRMQESHNINCTGILEQNGYCQNLGTQKEAFKTNIIAISHDFFSFQGNDSIKIKQGEVAVNKRLANFLLLKPGDDLAIHFREITDIPASAPFAPGNEISTSIVLKVGVILDPAEAGNFSLSISQITPMNIFVNLADIESSSAKASKINRLLIDERSGFSASQVSKLLRQTMLPSDIGIRLRKINKTNQYELTSDRIFIDDALVKEIRDLIPSSAPVLTYLGNRFIVGNHSTPYSFVSALPASLYPEICKDNRIIINTWMADDLKAKQGDTLNMYWYSPDSLNKLIERNQGFIIDRIVTMDGIWADSLLMPDFPGISGSESCSDWDAGIPIRMNEIRPKDEDYWNKYRGTPKAFINYEKGKELWGNNFGPATAIRFKTGVTGEEIAGKLNGSLDPDESGFAITDIAEESIKAADQSVDFGTLFLSLGFFLIIASIVLLSFAVSSYFDSKRGHLNTFFALGFKSGWIKKLLFAETGIIALAGTFAGAFSGVIVNVLITKALNSVWKGAVQTDTLNAFFNIVPIITGFVFTLFIVAIFMLIKIIRYLKMLNRKEHEIHKMPSPSRNLMFLVTSFILTAVFFFLSGFYKSNELSFYFASGTFLLVSMVFFWRQFFIGNTTLKNTYIKRKKGLSRLYYAHYPSNAVTPILFIAAGIFAVFITAANRMNFNDKYLQRSSGTGGYLLWCETAIPIKEDLNSASGRNATGLDIDQLSGLSFVQARVSAGNDASCLNLNHITSPPLMGIDPSDFVKYGAFSFANEITDRSIKDPWSFLNIVSGNNIIYGIADQTVLEWGLKHKTGDTLTLRAENGQPLKVIIAAGLQTSVFQGYVLIGMENFRKYYPSVSGSTVMLANGDPSLIDVYKNTLAERFANSGIDIEKTNDRLAAFYEVTNTYLSVFGVFGAFGMITAIAGLGFVLLRNYNQRKREFALMLATGFPFKSIRRMILTEQVIILLAGVSAGVISAIVATLPSIRERADLPWLFLTGMVAAITLTGLITLFLSVRSISGESLTVSLRRE